MKIIAWFVWIFIGLGSVIVGAITYKSNYEVAELWGKTYKRVIAKNTTPIMRTKASIDL